ncbi:MULTISPECIES: 50S ribosomal protein L17 [Fusobacterium]|jgi:large subunit ribosomal protein L17|uniref:50S ribosomal protein L17 n=1 Tax=Fusobacterium TaxID=848 RepID=UPI00047FC028|nr:MULTISPECIES: 50S ribosomal protein L17 [Fusobacterium]MCF2611423.1 50S ribosomal protein L17 [Fusobacterium perfoetens]MCI6153345.1 50S ribosomal protein L17 [Fusobacterium perfoetens]MDY3237148.1 50S ribosomal protein L17 [Fusobacterium perfoetens]NME36289.1 50S ribosomal protein L17 [Fusobacterium sp. FSA-380-WT-3A]
MNHNKSYRKLGRRADHRMAMLKNLTISLVKEEKLETTVTRAKELRKFAERMITLGKKGTLADRRRAFAFLRDEEAVAKLFNDLAPKYAERNGGYTRIIKTSVRKGDSAELAIIALV